MQERERLETVVVTAEQMRQIEERIFAAGMPVAALMEKVARAIDLVISCIGGGWEIIDQTSWGGIPKSILAA